MIRLRFLLILATLFLLVFVSIQAAPGSALTAVNLGETITPDVTGFNFSDTGMAFKQLQAILGGSADIPRHLRAIRAYAAGFQSTGETVPRLRELVIWLHGSKKPEAKIASVFTIGLLALEDSREARVEYMSQLAVLIGSIRNEKSTDPWGHLVTAVVLASLPDLSGNSFDEIIYAQCYGYQDAQIQLTCGNMLLLLDLNYSGNERLQWFAYLAFSRALELAADRNVFAGAIRPLVEKNMMIPGYQSTKWLRETGALCNG